MPRLRTTKLQVKSNTRVRLRCSLQWQHCAHSFFGEREDDACDGDPEWEKLRTEVGVQCAKSCPGKRKNKKGLEYSCRVHNGATPSSTEKKFELRCRMPRSTYESVREDILGHDPCFVVKEDELGLTAISSDIITRNGSESIVLRGYV